MAAIKISDLGRAIAYRAPSHAAGGVIMFKTPSYEKGVNPPHLIPFQTQLNGKGTQCKGKKGQSFRKCMITVTRSITGSVEHKMGVRQAYALKQKNLKLGRLPG